MDIAQARRFLELCDKVLVITGAGISAESGMKTYRNNDLSWRGHPYHEIVSLPFFEADPRASWDWHLETRAIAGKAEPNVAHLALADWAKRREGITLVTQNIDGLHERSGHPGTLTIHGSLWRNRCIACGTEREDTALVYDVLPVSPCCGAPERPAVVWFGEQLPQRMFAGALHAAFEADAVITVGTSGAVATAPMLVAVGRRFSAHVFDVNPDVTDIDANTRFHAPAGETLSALLAV